MLENYQKHRPNGATAPVASGGLLASQECRRVGARSSPRPDGVWGEKNAPVVSHHGYVRARRTSPAWTPV